MTIRKVIGSGAPSRGMEAVKLLFNGAADLFRMADQTGLTVKLLRSMIPVAGRTKLPLARHAAVLAQTYGLTTQTVFDIAVSSASMRFRKQLAALTKEGDSNGTGTDEVPAHDSQGTGEEGREVASA